MAIVIGTAGHVDHGKTSLVKALTGVDCDRLEEEKKRGITIELGFAALKINEELTLGIVDVPGHEKFIKNMVAGASGIDVVMLVIAADEGIMPQTREHIEICNLLGLRHGLVALTKIDTVDAEMLELAKEEVVEFLVNSSLENAPIFPLSSHTGEGIDALKDHIVKLNTSLSNKKNSDFFRLSVDRAFSMKGHGTVVTGTSLSGKASLNDELAIYPKNEVTSKIRAIQSHGQSVEEIEAGKRISINLANCSLEEVNRGDVLASPNSLYPTDRWLVNLHCLPSSPKGISHRKELHFHHGAKELLARVYLFDRQVLEPNESALAEIRYIAPANNENMPSKPLVGLFNDACVFRSLSPLRTIAGAKVLMPLDYSFKRQDFTRELQEKFLKLEEEYNAENYENFLLLHIDLAFLDGRDFNQLRVLSALNSKVIEKHLSSLLSKGEILCYSKEHKAYISKEAFSKYEEIFLNLLQNYHTNEPLKQGMLRDMLLSSRDLALDKSPQSQKLGLYILEKLQKTNKISYANEYYFLASFSVTLAKDEEEIQDNILSILRREPMTPPNIKDLFEEANIATKEGQRILKLLIEKKEIIRLNESIYYDAKTLQDIEAKTRLYFENNKELNPAAFKEISEGLSRKYIIPILEYFDAIKFTLRVGDIRVLRR